MTENAEYLSRLDCPFKIRVIPGACSDSYEPTDETIQITFYRHTGRLRHWLACVLFHLALRLGKWIK